MKPKVITHTPQTPAPPQASTVPAAAAAPRPAVGNGMARRATVIGPGASATAPPVVPAAVAAPPASRAVQSPAATTIVTTIAAAATTASPQAPGQAAAQSSVSEGLAAVARKAPPSVVPGTIRRGVQVSLPELAQRFAAATPEALQQAQQLLQATIVDTLGTAQAARWGDEAQQRYGALVDASLQITQSSTLQTSLRHIARLHALLQDMAEEWLAPAKTPLRFWKRSAGPAERLQSSQGELAQLRQHLADALPALRTLQADLQGVCSELAPLAVRLEALSLAAHYVADVLADTLDSGADPRAYALLQRASALAQTVVHIQGGLQLRQGSQHSLDGLIHRIQDTVLLALPAWMEQVALATQARQITDMNDTERYALAQQLQALLGRLHGA